MLDLRSFCTELAFDPETTRAMGIAFDEACKTLRLTDKADSATRLLADRIVDLATEGERDPMRLCDRALTFFKNGQ
jgi:hypothetical protein